jgi:hypothetical protein
MHKDIKMDRKMIEEEVDSEEQVVFVKDDVRKYGIITRI